MADTDRFGSLPDEILCHILTFLNLDCAVRCSILAKRWRFLHTQLPTLSFTPSDFSVEFDNCPRFKYDPIISNLLDLHVGDLKGFRFDLNSQSTSDHANVSRWVEYAALHKVRILSLNEGYYRKFRFLLGRVNGKLNPLPPSSLFSCTQLKTLFLNHYTLTCFPPDFSGFNKLTYCVFNSLTMTDNSLEHFISCCPLLNELEIYGRRRGFCNPAITAPNLCRLHLDIPLKEGLTVSCPKLQQIFVPHLSVCSSGINLKVEMIPLLEFSHMLCHAVISNKGDLLSLGLHICEKKPVVACADRFIEVMGSFTTLKKLTLSGHRSYSYKEEFIFPLGRLLEGLPNLRVLSLRDGFLKFLFEPLLSFRSSALLNLETINIHIWDLDENGMPALGWLLQSTPALKTLEVQLSPKLFTSYDSKKCFEILEELFYSKKVSADASIRIKD